MDLLQGNQMKKLFSVVCVLGVVLPLLSSCSMPAGRIMKTTEPDSVGSRAAGAAAFDQLLSGAVNKLLLSHGAAREAATKLSVAVLRVENASAEELGDWQEQIFDKISTSINESGRYQTISLRYIDAGLRESRLKSGDLFIPAKRRVFLDILETAKVPAQVLIFPKLTTGTTELGPKRAQRNYLLTLELVDISTGRDFRVSEEVRKAYR